MRDSKRDTDTKNRLWDSVGEGEGGMIGENSTEKCILPYVKQMTSPSLMHEKGTQSWCTGTTQREVMGRNAGGGFEIGDTYTPMADSCQCMAKTTKYCKVISL